MNDAQVKTLWNKFGRKNVSFGDFSRRMKAAMSPVSQQELAAMELQKARQRTAKIVIDRAIRERGQG